MRAATSRVLKLAALSAVLVGAMLSRPLTDETREAVVQGRESMPADSLAELNQAFRDAYARARKETLAQSGPIVLVSGDDLILLRDGKRTTARAVPETYHTLKTIAHVPLAVHVLLTPCPEGEITADRLAELRRYRERLSAVGDALKQRGLTAESLERQSQILSQSQEFLDGMLEARKVENASLRAFTRRLAGPVLVNAGEAARLQLDGLHKQMKTWRAELSPEEWRRLRVVVQGSALPRQGNLAAQYFARLLGEQGEGGRVVYAESLFEEARAVNLLGTHLLDTDIGRAFFDDARRMHRDLLADATAAYLKQMDFGPEGTPPPAAPVSQFPSPMVEHTRPHPRLKEERPPGRREKLEIGALFLPEKLSLKEPVPLFVHFHGAPWLPEVAAARHGGTAVISVQIGSGSRAYQKLFLDPAAFGKLLDEAERKAGVRFGPNGLTAWSAGYGAVREILRVPEHRERVSFVILLDGLHAGYMDGKPGPRESRLVEQDLKVFVEFARAAVAGKKRLLVTHTEIFPGTFASTTETADHLLRELGLKRQAILQWGPLKTQQLSDIRVGGLRVAGFAGNAAPDHVDQLHALPEFLCWVNELEPAKPER